MKEKMSVDLSRIFFSPESLDGMENGVVRVLTEDFWSERSRFLKIRNRESSSNTVSASIPRTVLSTFDEGIWIMIPQNLNRTALVLKPVRYRCWIYCRIPLNGRGRAGWADTNGQETSPFQRKGGSGEGKTGQKPISCIAVALHTDLLCLFIRLFFYGFWEFRMYVLLCQLLAAFTANSQQPVRFSEPRRSLSEGLCTLIVPVIWILEQVCFILYGTFHS